MQKSKEEMAEQYDLDHAEHLDDSEKIAYLAGYSAAQDEIKLLKAKLEKAVEQRNHAQVCTLDRKFAAHTIEKYDAELNALTLETILSGKGEA